MADDKREQLLEGIRGQTISIPNLRPVFEEWRMTNKNHHAVKPVLNPWIESLARNEKELAKLKRADFGLWASMNWPTAGPKQLEILGYFGVWLFLWDDELDEPTGEHTNNFGTAQKYRQETKQFIYCCLRLDGNEQNTSFQLMKGLRDIALQLKATLNNFLGLSSQKTVHSATSYGGFDGFRVVGEGLRRTLPWTLGRGTPKYPPTASSPAIERFRIVGEALAQAYTIEQRQNFFDEIQNYIHCTELEQKFKVEGKIPSLEEYWSYRMRSGAVVPCLALAEYANGIRGPYATTSEPALKALCDDTNIIILIGNDILSLKKEIAYGSVDTLIPLLCLQHSR